MNKQGFGSMDKELAKKIRLMAQEALKKSPNNKQFNSETAKIAAKKALIKRRENKLAKLKEENEI